jgi:hypothetical protein
MLCSREKMGFCVMTDVFISYARKDRNRVRLIAHALAAEGFAVWWDPEIKPGAKWNEVIRKALESAGAVVTVWSKTSAKSNWVLAETTHGSNRQALVPVMIQPCDPPIPFNMVQSADLTEWRGDGNDTVWMQTLERVRALVEAKRRLLAAAPPPGEAYGAERAATGAGGSGSASGSRPIMDAQFEELHYRPGARRQGPRLLRMVAGGVVGAAVLTAGIWAAPAVIDAVQTRTAAPTAPAPSVTPVSQPGSDSPPASTEPVAPSAPPAVDNAVSSPTEPPAATPDVPAQTTPVPPPTRGQPQTPPPQQTVDATPQLDTCINRLVSLCRNATGPATGFAADGRLSGAERSFLDGLMINAQAPVSADAVNACQGVVQARSAATSARQRATVFDAACRQVSFPPAQQQPTQPTTDQPGRTTFPTREVIDAITQSRPSTTTQTPQQPGTQQPPTRQQTPTSVGQPRQEGPISMRLRQTFTLDADTMRESREGADVFFQASTATERALVPQNRAQIAILGQAEPSYAACLRGRYATEAAPIGDNLAGQSFCVRTANGAIVGIRVVAGPGQSPGVLSLTGTIWTPPG